jgi:hypothetical protein
MVLTLLIVASGFVGRYIYTSIPRTAGGVPMPVADVQATIAALDRQLGDWPPGQPQEKREPAKVMAASASKSAGSGTQRKRVSRSERRMASEKAKVQKQSQTLAQQLATINQAQRFLAAWHTIHVPLGMVLFSAATLHALATLYLHTLGR